MGEVIDLNCVTSLDLDPDRVLSKAIGKLNSALIIGYDKDGDEYFSSSVSSGPECLWLLERAKKKLMEVVE